MTVVNLGGSRSPEAGHPATRALGRRSLLYEDVIDMVEKLVADRQLKPGDLLPTQAELAELAGVSLITVRRALEELERAGQVRRRQGLGTFVAHPRILAEPTRPGGFLATIGDAVDSGSVVTTVLRLEQGVPSRDVAVALHMRRGAKVFELRRCRALLGRPLIVETAFIPSDLAPGLDTHREALSGSLYEFLADHYGLVDEYEEQLLEVVLPNAEERRLLRLGARAQVARLRGRSLDRNGVVFDCFEQVYPAADFAFSIAGATSRQLVRGRDERDWRLVSSREARPR